MKGSPKIAVLGCIMVLGGVLATMLVASSGDRGTELLAPVALGIALGSAAALSMWVLAIKTSMPEHPVGTSFVSITL
jgi:hypothetical protein